MINIITQYAAARFFINSVLLSADKKKPFNIQTKVDSQHDQTSININYYYHFIYFFYYLHQKSAYTLYYKQKEVYFAASKCET